MARVRIHRFAQHPQRDLNDGQRFGSVAEGSYGKLDMLTSRVPMVGAAKAGRTSETNPSKQEWVRAQLRLQRLRCLILTRPWHRARRFMRNERGGDGIAHCYDPSVDPPAQGDGSQSRFLTIDAVRRSNSSFRTSQNLDQLKSLGIDKCRARPRATGGKSMAPVRAPD